MANLELSWEFSLRNGKSLKPHGNYSLAAWQINLSASIAIFFLYNMANLYTIAWQYICFTGNPLSLGVIFFRKHNQVAAFTRMT